MKKDLMGSASRLSYNNAASALDPLDIVHRSYQIMGYILFSRELLLLLYLSLCVYQVAEAILYQRKKKEKGNNLFLFIFFILCAAVDRNTHRKRRT